MFLSDLTAIPANPQLQAAADKVQQYEVDSRALHEAKAALSASLTQTENVLAHLQAEHNRLNIVQASVQSDNAGLQQRLADRAVEITALNQQLTQTRIQFEHYQESIAAQRSEERQAAEQRLTRFEQDLAGAQQRWMTQQSSISQQEMQIAHLRTENGRLQETARSVLDELESIRSERDQSAYQLKEMSLMSQTTASKFEAAQQTLTEARIALAAQEKQTELLTEHVARADGKTEKLDQERSALIQERAELQAQVANWKRADQNNNVNNLTKSNS